MQLPVLPKAIGFVVNVNMATGNVRDFPFISIPTSPRMATDLKSIKVICSGPGYIDILTIGKIETI
jgi:hypothetical protein